MKAILSVFILSFSVSFFAHSQTKQPVKASSSDCFKEWYSLFKERGATPVPDGTNDVIITLRNNEYTECFMGRVEVSNGKLARIKSSTKG